MKSCSPIFLTRMRSTKKGKKKQTARHVSCLSLHQSINTNTGEQPFTLRLCKCLKQVRKLKTILKRLMEKRVCCTSITVFICSCIFVVLEVILLYF